MSNSPCIDYAYTHSQTRATTGYFSCEPPENLDRDAALALLEATPLDDFLHQHLLRLLGREKPQELAALAATAYDSARDSFTRPALAGLLLECALLVPALSNICQCFPPDAAVRLAGASPAVYLRAIGQADRQAATRWSALFRANICEHHPLPRSDEADIAPLYPVEDSLALYADMAQKADVMAREHARIMAEGHPAQERPPAQETFLRAVDALMENGILAGPEMRHEASLSPIALLRAWQVDMAVECGALRHTLRGQATAYGRGLSLAQTRASYAMEIVERASAYVSIAGHSVLG
ncbi:MAG: bacteriocin, partial [Desulfovibrionaceae bacterium]|nr:bacteriocin [Desulfovibrionaceae bacterium]